MGKPKEGHERINPQRSKLLMAIMINISNVDWKGKLKIYRLCRRLLKINYKLKQQTKDK